MGRFERNLVPRNPGRPTAQPGAAGGSAAAVAAGFVPLRRGPRTVHDLVRGGGMAPSDGLSLDGVDPLAAPRPGPGRAARPIGRRHRRDARLMSGSPLDPVQP